MQRATSRQILLLSQLKDFHTYSFWMKDGTNKELTFISGILFYKGSAVTHHVDLVYYWVDRNNRPTRIL